MELDEASLDGHWATNTKSGVEFFIINDATFSKLCILGSDVEPCFEGASVTDKQVSREFSTDPSFMNTLFTMMNELKDALQYKNEGGSSMEDAALEAQEITEVEEQGSEFVAEDSHADDVVPTSFADDDEETGETGEDESADEDNGATDDDDGKNKKKPNQNHSLEEIENQFAAIQTELQATKAELESTKAELQSLRTFKLGIENQQKDELIAKYHMLSDEARKEISEHKTEYTINEIEAKLALAFVKENVDFNEVDGKKADAEKQEEPITTFSLDAAVDTTLVSPVLQALRDAKNN